jgi:hypothetical protein
VLIGRELDGALTKRRRGPDSDVFLVFQRISQETETLPTVARELAAPAIARRPLSRGTPVAPAVGSYTCGNT